MTFWGTGIHIASRDALMRDNWRGVGLLGKILMGICDRQKESNLLTNDTDMSTDEPRSDPAHASNAT